MASFSFLNLIFSLQKSPHLTKQTGCIINWAKGAGFHCAHISRHRLGTASLNAVFPLLSSFILLQPILPVTASFNSEINK